MDSRVGPGQLPEAVDPANAPGEGASGGLTGQFVSSSPCIPPIVKLLEDRRALGHRLRDRAHVRSCAERSGSSYRCSATLVSSPSRLQLPRAAANSGPVRLPVGARFGMTSSIVSSRCNSRPSQRSSSRRPYSSVLQEAHALGPGGLGTLPTPTRFTRHGLGSPSVCPGGRLLDLSSAASGNLGP